MLSSLMTREIGRHFIESLIYESKDSLTHFGIKGMKWGYTDKKKNGKRTAEDEKPDAISGAAKYQDGKSAGEKISRNRSIQIYLKSLLDKTDEQRKKDGTYWDLTEIKKMEGAEKYTDKELRQIIDLLIYDGQMEAAKQLMGG